MAASKQPQQSVSHPNGCVTGSGTWRCHRASFVGLVLQEASFTQRVSEVVSLIVKVAENTGERGLDPPMGRGWF